MRHLDARLRDERVEARGHLVDRDHAVVQEERLSAARELPADGRADRRVGVARDVRLGGDALARGRAQEREVARAGHGEVERARDGRRAHRQHVGRRAQALEELLVPDPEALLLVDDDEAEVVELHLARKDRVRADDDVRRAGEEARARAFLRLGALEPAHRLDADWRAVEAREERLEVLLGEDRGGSEKRHLLAVHRGDEGGAHGDLRLAVAGVAADEAVHRLRGGHVLLHVRDGGGLVGRRLVGERLLERGELACPYVVGEARHDGTARLRLEEGGGEVLHRLLRVLLVARPALAVEAVELHLLALHAHVAREEVRVGDGHVQLRAVRVLDREHLAALPGHLHLGGAEEAADAVVDVNHIFAGFDVERLGEALAVRGGRCASVCAAVAERAVALRDHHEAGHLEAAFERLVLDDERAFLFRRHEVGRQPRARRVQQLGLARRLRAQFGETRQRHALERRRRHAARRGIAREDLPEMQGRGHVVGVVFQPKDRSGGWEDGEDG